MDAAEIVCGMKQQQARRERERVEEKQSDLEPVVIDRESKDGKNMQSSSSNLFALFQHN